MELIILRFIHLYGFSLVDIKKLNAYCYKHILCVYDVFLHYNKYIDLHTSRFEHYIPKLIFKKNKKITNKNVETKYYIYQLTYNLKKKVSVTMKEKKRHQQRTR